jgi:fatty acid desaturase
MPMKVTASADQLSYLPQLRNFGLSASAILFQLAGLILTPVIWSWGGVSFAVYLALYGYATIMCWLLIHEAIHHKLLRNRAANDFLGRVHAILFGCPFYILKIGHLTHHRYNRSELDTTELVPAETKHFVRWWLAYYGRILGLLYLSEVISPLAFYFWKNFKRLVIAWTQSNALAAIFDLFTRRMVQAIQMDAVLCVGFLAAQIYFNWHALTPFILLFFWRGLIVSYYDNAYHYGTDPHDNQAANNLAVPGMVRPLILNHNMHRVHHRHPSASWAVLPELFVADNDGYDGVLISTGMQQIKGPTRRPNLPSPAESRWPAE